MAREKPNVVLELSLWQIIYRDDPGAFVRALDTMRREIGIERIVFGSDFPGPREVLPLKEWVCAIKQLPSLGEQQESRSTTATLTRYSETTAPAYSGSDQAASSCDDGCR